MTTQSLPQVIDTPPETPCTCPGPGFCPRFQMEQQDYPWSLCQGTAPGCTPERSLKKRQQWFRDAHSAKEHALPSVAQTARNVAQAALRAATGVAKGLPVLSSREVSEVRLATCRANPCGYYRTSDDRCSHRSCGCHLTGRTLLGMLGLPGKTEIATEKCPEGWWGPVQSRGRSTPPEPSQESP